MAKQAKRKRRTKERRNISISLPTETIEDLDELARLIGKRIGGIRISRSGAVTIAAHKELERERAGAPRPVGRPRKHPVSVPVPGTTSQPPPAPKLWDPLVPSPDEPPPPPPDVIVGKED